MRAMHSSSLARTFDIAADFAKDLRKGDFVALEGNLGAGKTQFVKGLVRGLGGEPHIVSSPTFVLLNIYSTPAMMVYHLDAYRISGVEDLEAIGFDELLDQQELVIVEWWQRVREIVPSAHWRVRLSPTSVHGRDIEISQLL